MQFWPEGDKAPSKANFQALEGALEILFYFQPEMFQEKLFLGHFRNSGNEFSISIEILFYFQAGKRIFQAGQQFPSWQAGKFVCL